MDMGIGNNSGGVYSLSKGMMFVNGTAPFVYSGVITSSLGSAFIRMIKPVAPFSNYNPPTADTVTGLDHYVGNISPQKYTHSNFDGDTRYFKLGELTLPQNGRQARITLMANQGYDVSTGINAQAFTPKNYCCEIYIHSSNNFSSISTGVGTEGCYHYGFVINKSIFAKPENVYIFPDTTDPKNIISVWVQNTAFWGAPLIEVSTNGTWYHNTAMSATLPTTGFIQLPFRRTTII
jgi:hypothetical protein